MVYVSHMKCWQLLAILLMAFIGTATAEEEEEALSLSSEVTAVQEGKDTEIECSKSETLSNVTKLLWYRGENATDTKLISEDETVAVSANFTNGLLTIKNAQLNFTGFYLCQTEGGNYSITAELHVYVMPSYFKEGMIIVGINAALVLLFIVCGVYTFIKKTRKRKHQKSAPQKPAKPEP